jgi:hypothetical protein
MAHATPAMARATDRSLNEKCKDHSGSDEQLIREQTKWQVPTFIRDLESEPCGT